MSADSGGRQRPGAAAGFSQVEVLVAMLIIGLATPFLIGGVMGGLTQARHSQDRGAATAWAQSEIELLRQRCFAHLVPSARKVTAATLEPGELPPPPGFTAGYIVLDVQGPALLKVSVGLYRDDWTGEAPNRPAYTATSTYIGDIRVAGGCP